MRIIKPTPITPAMLTACNVPETDQPAWSATTAYVVGNQCLSNHKIYYCLVANTNFLPENNTGGTTPKWLDEGYDNRWKMFDAVVGSQTVLAESITLSLKPGVVIDSAAFLDVVGTKIIMTITDPVAGLVYSDTLDLISHSGVIDAYTYFFKPIITDDTAVLLGIPPYSAATMSITINNPGGTAKIGTIVIGLQTDIGVTQYNPTVGFDSWSKIERDAFGIMTVLVRGYSKKLTCELVIPAEYVDAVGRIFRSVKDIPVVWVGVDSGYSSMIVYGIIKSCPISITHLSHSVCNLEIEGFV